MDDPINLDPPAKRRPAWVSDRMREVLVLALAMTGTGGYGVVTIGDALKDLSMQMRAVQERQNALEVRLAVLETRLGMRQQ